MVEQEVGDDRAGSGGGSSIEQVVMEVEPGRFGDEGHRAGSGEGRASSGGGIEQVSGDGRASEMEEAELVDGDGRASDEAE
ncbi:hypothetical protein Dimus_002677 [Dionaea muscipula]